MKIGVMGDSHGNIDYVRQAAEYMMEAEVEYIIHLGDDYYDARVLDNLPVNVIKVPGVYEAVYQDASIPNRLVEEIAGLKILITHTKDSHRNDLPYDKMPEEFIASRAANEKIRQEILNWVGNEEKRWTVPGASLDFMCRGNIDGGLTTLEEKALGAIHKGGHRPIKGVLRNRIDYLEPVPLEGGFYLQEGTHEEIPAITYMAAAGVNIIVFATGRGGVFGHAICPVIRVTGNPETWAKMSQDMDVNASTIMEGKESIESVGKRILEEVINVASGKPTISEQMGMANFAVWKHDPRLEALLGLL